MFSLFCARSVRQVLLPAALQLVTWQQRAVPGSGKGSRAASARAEGTGPRPFSGVLITLGGTGDGARTQRLPLLESSHKEPSDVIVPGSCTEILPRRVFFHSLCFGLLPPTSLPACVLTTPRSSTTIDSYLLVAFALTCTEGRNWTHAAEM